MVTVFVGTRLVMTVATVDSPFGPVLTMVAVTEAVDPSTILVGATMMPVLCVDVEPEREKISVCGRTEVRAVFCANDVKEETENEETKYVVVTREVIIREIVDREVLEGEVCTVAVEVKSSRVVEIAPAPALESVFTACDFVAVFVSTSPFDFTGITTGMVGYESDVVEAVVLEDVEELEVVEADDELVGLDECV